jgi:hypothetical protein
MPGAKAGKLAGSYLRRAAPQLEQNRASASILGPQLRQDWAADAPDSPDRIATTACSVYLAFKGA